MAGVLGVVGAQHATPSRPSGRVLFPTLLIILGFVGAQHATPSRPLGRVMFPTLLIIWGFVGPQHAFGSRPQGEACLASRPSGVRIVGRRTYKLKQ